MAGFDPEAVIYICVIGENPAQTFPIKNGVLGMNRNGGVDDTGLRVRQKTFGRCILFRWGEKHRCDESVVIYVIDEAKTRCRTLFAHRNVDQRTTVFFRNNVNARHGTLFIELDDKEVGSYERPVHDLA